MTRFFNISLVGSLLAAIAAATFGGTASAELITPVSILDASSEYADRLAIDTINSSGLDITGTYHNNDPAQMWLSGPGGTNATITWDLGKDYVLTGFHLWNYCEWNGPGYTTRGIGSADILISTTPDFSSPTIFAGYNSFVEGEALNPYSGEDYVFPGNAIVTGRYVRFTNTTNLGDPNFIGIAEIRFAIPEPSTVLLLGLGGLLVARGRKWRARG